MNAIIMFYTDCNVCLFQWENISLEKLQEQLTICHNETKLVKFR